MDGSYREQLTNAIRELLPGVFFAASSERKYRLDTATADLVRAVGGCVRTTNVAGAVLRRLRVLERDMPALADWNLI